MILVYLRVLISPLLYRTMLCTLEPPHERLVALAGGSFRVRGTGTIEGVFAVALSDNVAFDALIHLLQEREMKSQQKQAIRRVQGRK